MNFLASLDENALLFSRIETYLYSYEFSQIFTENIFYILLVFDSDALIRRYDFRTDLIASISWTFLK